MKKWVTLAFLSLAFFFYMTDRQLFGLLVIPIQQETGLNDIQLGFVDMAMYWVLACAMPFSGLLGDRFPRGRIIAVSIILWGVLAALTGLAGGLAGFLLFRSVGMTAAQTLYAPSAYALMASEHKTTRTIAFSTHQGAMYVGMLSSGLLVGVILSAFGSWRNVYFIFGGVTAAVGVAFALVCGRETGGSDGAGPKKSLLDGMKAFFGNGAALCAGTGYVALTFVADACMAWAPKFVATKFALDVGAAGRGVMFGPNLAAMMAVLGAGLVTDFFVHRYPRFRLGLQIITLLAGAPLFLIFGRTSSLGMVWFALIGWGIVRGLFQANSITSVFDVVPPESRSSAVGFLNLFAYLIGSLAPLVIGVLSHRYGVAGFEIGFASMGGVLVVAAAVMLFSYLFLFEKKRVER